jgi:LPXTG-motif cell wall-anchored protein
MSNKKTHPGVPFLLALLTLAAGSALGQNADQNSAGPTRNDFRLRIVEPADGATIVGGSVRVTVANSMPRTTQDTRGTNNMPNPSFRVYLGNTLKGELKRDDNVLTIENVPVGSQLLVVEAVNTSGEIIDRKEARFRTIANEPETSAPVVSSNEPPTEAPPAPRVAPAVEPAPAEGATASTLPQTGSPAPRAAMAGGVLILAGLLASRKRRA